MTDIPNSAAVATFDSHAEAEAAVKALTSAGFEPGQLSVLGKGYHTEEKVMGFYSTGERIKFWGKQGAVWGGLWGLLFGGLLVSSPLTGPAVIVGYLASVAVAAIEGAVVVGGVGAIGAAIYSIGIPKDSVLRYEAAVKADNFLVLVHGDAATVEKARTTLASNGVSVDVHNHLSAPTGALSAA